MAAYECSHCSRQEFAPRRYLHHFGEQCRCPKCGTFRVVKLKQRDKIDPMNTGFLHWFERLAGGRLYYCCFCRLQFYDRRPMVPRVSKPVLGPEPLTSPPDTARSGA